MSMEINHIPPNTDSSAAMAQAQSGRSEQIGSDLQRAVQSGDHEEIQRVAQEFEGVFLAQILKPMFEGINLSDTIGGGGRGEEIYRDLMLDEYGRKMASSGGIGLADHIARELVEIQAAASRAHHDAPHQDMPAPAITGQEGRNLKTGP